MTFLISLAVQSFVFSLRSVLIFKTLPLPSPLPAVFLLETVARLSDLCSSMELLHKISAHPTRPEHVRTISRKQA